MWRRSHTSGGVRTSDGTVSGWRVGLGFITMDNERAIDFQELIGRYGLLR